ncbi:hypothetical protein M405DRAFT_914978 [Rhizopogon salebrosus TDB-379]|nr:hypothetical protein M405DRAFT_914978 [Rhizopogon salebrosus TDB-379]
MDGVQSYNVDVFEYARSYFFRNVSACQDMFAASVTTSIGQLKLSVQISAKLHSSPWNMMAWTSGLTSSKEEFTAWFQQHVLMYFESQDDAPGEMPIEEYLRYSNVKPNATTADRLIDFLHFHIHLEIIDSINEEKSRHHETLPLQTSRPLFQHDRRTITVTQGNLEAYGRRRRTYIVASDLSEESRYAVEWGMGTVIQDGDNLLIITVMENEAKVDPAIPNSHQGLTYILVRQATSLLQCTRLNVTVSCQA